MNSISYDTILDINKIAVCYRVIKLNTKNKDKLCKFECFYGTNIINILEILTELRYKHSKYSIFLINYPKARIIMSESINDKIINHLVSKYILEPTLESKFIPTNVATRKDLGTKAGIMYMKKFINSLKENNDKIYVLKCDISKFFYSIDHEMLLDKLRKNIKDERVMILLKEIIESTNLSYINDNIKKIKLKRIDEINNMNISEKEKTLLIETIKKIPYYEYGKGLPIGNYSSQILAIFFLNDLDHFIKEKLGVKYYIRYMDDLILISPNKNFLKYCLKEIEEQVKLLKLKLNNKTQIYEIHNGVPFLGFRFILKNKRLHMLINSKVKKRIDKHIKDISIKDRANFIKSHYYGYLCWGDTSGYIFDKIIYK